MPRGPFAPVQQQDIADTRLVAENLPISEAEAGAGVFAAVTKGASAALEANRRDFEKGIKSDLRDELNATELGLAAVRDPNVLKTITDAAAEGNPFFQKAKEEFLMIADAVKQGKLPGNAATIRTEAVLASAISKNPEFTEELRTEARAALGFSPEAQVFKNLLSEPRAGAKTEAQKLQEEINATVQILGIPEDVVRSGMRNKMLAEFETNQIELQLKRGEIQGNRAADYGDVAANTLSMDLISQLNAQISQQGGVVDVELFKNQVTTQFAALKSKMTSQMGPNVDTKIRANALRQVDEHQQAVVRMVEDGSFTKIMTEKNELIQTMVLNNALNVPELAAIHTLAGKEGLVKYFDVVSKATTKAQFDILTGPQGPLSGIRNIGEFGTKMAESIKNQSRGIPSANDQERVFRSLFNFETLKDAKSEDKVEAAGRLESDLGSVSAIKHFTDPVVLMNTKNDGKLAAKFTNIFSSAAAGVQQDLQSFQDQFGAIISFDGTAFSIPRTEKLRSQSLEAFVSEGQLIKAVDSANTLLEVANMYTGAGIIKFDINSILPNTEVSDEDRTSVAEEKVFTYNPDTDELLEQ